MRPASDGASIVPSEDELGPQYLDFHTARIMRGDADFRLFFTFYGYFYWPKLRTDGLKMVR